MGTRAISAVFDAREKAEEAVTQLSQLGLEDVFIKTAPYLPDFSPTGIGSLSFLGGEIRNLTITIVTGTIPENRREDAERIIRKYGGLT